MPLDVAPLWGLACGVTCGGALGLVAAFSGGPLGGGRFAAVGPSGWQVAVVSALEIGVATAITAGAANYLSLRRTGSLATGPGTAASRCPAAAIARDDAAADGHLIYVNPWTGEAPRRPPAALGAVGAAVRPPRASQVAVRRMQHER